MKFLSLTGLIVIQPITKERNVVTFLDIILIATMRKTNVKVLWTSFGMTVTGMIMVVIHTEKIGYQMVNLEMASKNGLNAISLQKTKHTSQNVAEKNNNTYITNATCMVMVVKMNFGTNATGKN